MKHRKLILFSISTILLIVIVIIVVCNRQRHGDVIADNRQVIILHNNAILSRSRQLIMIGYLIQKSNKNLYLKVSDQFIEKLYPLVKKDLLQNDQNTSILKCLEILPLRDRHNLGAHILIFKGKRDFILPNRPYHFVINNYIKAIIFKKYHGTLVKETWYELAVSSPELATQFSDITHPDNFHISIAVAKTRVDNCQCYVPPWQSRLWQWL